MTEPQKPAPPARPVRWVRIVLALSLAFNLLVVGLVAGSAWKWQKGGGPPRVVEFSMGPFGRALSREDRRALSEALVGRGDLRPPSPRELRAASDEVIAILRATPFDGAAFAAALDALRREARSLQDAGQAALVERVIAMSDAERAAFADRVERQVTRGPRPEPDGDRGGE